MIAVLVLFLVAAALGASFVIARAFARRLSRRRARKLVGPTVAVDTLGAHHGERVVLRGFLEGGELTTRFGPAIRDIADVHPDAKSSRPDTLRLRTGGRSIELVGTVQVVVGEREERLRQDGGVISVRRVGERCDVMVAGVAVRSDEGSYREPHFVIAAKPDGAWAERPISVVAVDGRSGRTTAAVLVLATLAMGATWMVAASRPSRVSSTDHGAPEKPCREEIFALLDKNDIFGAEAALATCHDERARAETMWALGRVDEAAKLFQASRPYEAAMPFTLSEAQAVVVSQPKPIANELLQQVRKDWYRGPSDPSQRALDCLGGNNSTDWRPCVPDANIEFKIVPTGYGNPVSVVTDTFRFARDLPRRGMGRDPYNMDTDYGERCESIGCRAAKSASLALFAGLAADGPRAAREFAVLDELVVAFDSGQEPRTHGGYGGITSQALLSQAAFAAAAVAAWYVHDDLHVTRYLSRAEAHTANTLAQHLELGQKGGTPKGDSSKWSAIDLELHGLAPHEAPGAFVNRLKHLEYSNPLRLYALLGARPQLRSAARAWVEEGFVPACRTCGVFAMMEATAKRREAARIVGANDLEAKLAEVSRRFGEVWMRDASRKTLWSLELLYAAPE